VNNFACACQEFLLTAFIKITISKTKKTTKDIVVQNLEPPTLYVSSVTLLLYDPEGPFYLIINGTEFLPFFVFMIIKIRFYNNKCISMFISALL